ncbi:cytidylate kinase-like family protein [Tautonia sp. JC769]|uniref:cytidylate kinase-like family protein n=1 Tax=Tautonia sp. JC769 TaxID=3232135 RepID=UPI00345912D7
MIGDASRSSTNRSARGLRAVMARWFSGQPAPDLATEPNDEPRPRFRVVCLSREAGAGGSALGRMVAERLGWTVYDARIVEAIAERMERPIEEVEALDELSPSVVQDWLLPLREEHWAPLEAYLDHLAKLVLSIGHAGDAVIVGRGAGFMIPRHEVLSVRIVSPIKARARRLSERLGVTPRTARRLAIDLDRRRRKFARTMFRVDDTDPHSYDLVIDTESIGLPIACELIARAIEAGQPPASPALALPGPRDDRTG